MGPVRGVAAGDRTAAFGSAAGISTVDARALLRSCDRRTAVGRRDYAVILILQRLGMRACEVAALRLEDCQRESARQRACGSPASGYLRP